MLNQYVQKNILWILSLAVLIRVRIRICVDPDPFNVFFLQDVSEARWNFFLKPRSASIRECYRLLLYSLRKSNSTKISLLLSSYFTTLQDKSKWYLLIFILIFFHKSFVYSFIQLTRLLDDVSHWECWKNVIENLSFSFFVGLSINNDSQQENKKIWLFNLLTI